MGIRTDPGYELFGTDCLTCWPVGFTPLKLYCSFTGITLPDPLGPNPPNSIWTLEQIAPIGAVCRWENSAPHWLIRYELGPIASTLWAQWQIGSFAFFGGENNPCISHFVNTDLESPWYLGGSAFISPRPIVNSDPSLKGVMSLLNIEPDRSTFGEIFPVDADTSIYKFNRKSDKTNILIKIDHTLF